ncbi:hypothetical protein [Desulfovulcanus sp.]
MEIQVHTNFLGPLTQKFFVKAIDDKKSKEYKCAKETDDWDFKMYEENKVILESKRIKLSKKETFWGHQEYEIIYKEKAIGIFKKKYFYKEIVVGEKRFPFPTLLRRNISGLNLQFPFTIWIWRRKVKSYCQTSEENILMLSVAMTIYIWFTWNRIGAD